MTVTQTAKDAAYIAVGLGVLGFQKAQVARVDLTKSLTEERGKLQTQVKTNIEDARSAVDAQLTEAKVQLAKAITQLEKTLEPVQKTIDARLDVLQDRLPGNVQTVVKQARERTNTAREQVKSLVAA